MTTRRIAGVLLALPIAVWMLASVAPPAAAQPAAQPAAAPALTAADILTKFPAASPWQRDRLADQLLALGEPGVGEATRQLVGAGGGKDVNARWALNAAVTRASQFGREGQRALAEKALIGALAASQDVEVRTFLLSQLQRVGREPAAQAAAPLVADAALLEPATQLLLVVKGPTARTALIGALAAAKGPGRITVVKALGELGAAEANDQVLALAKDPDVTMRKAALITLARFAKPASSKTMLDAAARAGYGYDPSNATAALIDYTRNLANGGDVAGAEKLCRQIMKKTDKPGLLATRASALAVLAEAKGVEALPDLVAAVDHRDKTFRESALRAAEPIGGVVAVRRWVAKAQAVSASRRAEIVAMLGRQGDPRALPFIRSSVGAPEPDVMLAAAQALVRAERANAIPDLLAALKTAPPESVGRLTDLLLTIVDEPHLDPLVAALDTLPLPSKAAAINVIGARSGRRFADRVLAFTADANPAIKAAAFGALAGVARPSDMPALVKLLDSAPADVVPQVQKAVAASADISDPGAPRIRPLVQAIPGAANPDRLIDTLPLVGTGEALAAVLAQLDTGTEAGKAAAFRALTRWPNTDAMGRLLTLVAAGDPSYRNQAFSAFVRQVSSSSMPADQKVLMFRKVLGPASTVGDKRIVLRALESIRTFRSFMLASTFMNDKELAAEAAGSVIRIAVPNSGGSPDAFAGTIVRETLTKASTLVTGQQRENAVERVRAFLDAMPKDEGFVPMFNGTDLAGWQGLVENPIIRAKLTPEEMAKKQAAANDAMRTNWSVRDGAIVFNGKGSNLCSVKEYGDFEMIVDWRITKDGDSGIYLRGSPQVQIWDPARTDVGAQVGSGGLYNNQKNPSAPLSRVDNPLGDWNTFRIVMIGDKVTVFLNGTKVVDNVTMENYWDRAQPIFPRGAIELQAHGTDLAFRDLYVRELTSSGYSLTEEERADGFVSLFNGRDLEGWTGNKVGYKAEGGAIVFDPKAPDRSNLYAEKDYGDFVFRFEFQLTPGGNSGVGIRAPRTGDAAYVGMEIQVLDNEAPIYANLQPYQYHGSVYGVIPAKRGFLRPVGEWNSEEIRIQGSRIRVTLNGTVILDGDLAEATKYGPMDHRAHPGLDRDSGAIGWLSHDSVVKFRNIRIRDLSR